MSHDRAEAMLALVLMDHALLHRAQNVDVMTKTPKFAGSVVRPPHMRKTFLMMQHYLCWKVEGVL